MNILSYLYTLIITPLELLFENIFMIANRIIGNEGLSIIFLSLAVNLLVLPLYKRADTASITISRFMHSRAQYLLCYRFPSS